MKFESFFFAFIELCWVESHTPQKYKKYPFIIKIKGRTEWNGKIEGENKLLQKILLQSYVSFLDSTACILASIYKNAEAKQGHYFQYYNLVE